jgi:hypothetical protein
MQALQQESLKMLSVWSDEGFLSPFWDFIQARTDAHAYFTNGKYELCFRLYREAKAAHFSSAYV